MNYCVKYYNIQCLKDCLNTILGVKQSKYSFKLVKCDHYFLVEKNKKKIRFFLFFFKIKKINNPACNSFKYVHF